MTYTVVLLSRARVELLDSWLWYEEKQNGLGDRFKNKVFDCLLDIEKHPEHNPIRKRPYREALVDTFPYLVIYRILKKEKQIVVSSIFHASRNPRKKHS